MQPEVVHTLGEAPLPPTALVGTNEPVRRNAAQTHRRLRAHVRRYGVFAKNRSLRLRFAAENSDVQHTPSSLMTWMVTAGSAKK